MACGSTYFESRSGAACMRASLPGRKVHARDRFGAERQVRHAAKEEIGVDPVQQDDLAVRRLMNLFHAEHQIFHFLCVCVLPACDGPRRLEGSSGIHQNDEHGRQSPDAANFRSLAIA